MSGPLANSLSKCVDFVIGHGKSGVGDQEAISFCTTLFTALGRGRSLAASFQAAKPASEPFCLHALRFNPETFFLPVPNGQSLLFNPDTPASKLLTQDDNVPDDGDCCELEIFLKK